MKIHCTAIIEQLDKYRKHLLWSGSSLEDKKPPKAALQMVCLSKEEGGLRVLDLTAKNDALLMNNIHKFFNHDKLT